MRTSRFLGLLAAIAALFLGASGGVSAAPPASKPAALRFVAVGDTGKGNEGQRQVAAAMAAKCAKDGCDFVLLLGDNIYESGVSSATDPQLQSKFEQPYAALDVPFYVVLGNHDYGGHGSGDEPARGAYEIEYTQHSKKWKMPAATYHFSQGPAEIFALDTTAEIYGRSPSQKAEMLKWITTSTATWKIAAGHHPYLSNGPHGNAGSSGKKTSAQASSQRVKELLEGAVCGKADLYLSGHDHNRQWLQSTCDGTELAVSGAGATTTSLPGSNPVRFQDSSLGFLYVRIEDRSLNAEFIDTLGKVQFTRTLTK